MMSTDSHNHKLTLRGTTKIVVITTIIMLLFAFVGPISYVHAADSYYYPDAQTADSLPTNAPTSCLFWDSNKSQLNGTPQWVSIPNLGILEIDDTVYANGCTTSFTSADLFMSGLVYVHWETAPLRPVTVTLQSQVTIHALHASWNASAGVNAGANANSASKPEATIGASTGINFTVSPSDTTVMNATSTITNQTSAYFSYQNLQATALLAAGAKVTQIDTITITAGTDAQRAFNETVETPFS